MKVAVITCILPYTYKKLKPPLHWSADVDYWAITDKAQHTPPWKDRVVLRDTGITSLRDCQRYRVLSHRLFPEYDYTIWVDGEVYLRLDPKILVGMLKDSGHGIGFIAHPQRDCIYEEAKVYEGFGAVDRVTIADQLTRYRLLRYPKHEGLITVNFFIRDNKSPDIIRLMERWHKETVDGCCRTQISFPYASWAENVPYWTIPWSVLCPDRPEKRMDAWQDNSIYNRKDYIAPWRSCDAS